MIQTGAMVKTSQPDIRVITDRWEQLAGSRFVGPTEYEQHAPLHVRRSLIDGALVTAFAAAADAGGVLLDFKSWEFYEQHVSTVLRDEDDPADWKLDWNRFAATALMDAEFRLVTVGLLATRGNGDSVDYRLTLPPAPDNA